MGYFAGPALRALYVFSGLLGTAMIGGGLVLWSAKRKAKLAASGPGRFGVAVVDSLNLGTIIGLPIAIGAYFWANQLMPPGMVGRHDWEVHAMFITWAAMLIFPVWRPLSRAWVEMTGLAAATYAFIPVLNVLTTDRHLAVTIAHGDWGLAGFDLATLVVGLAFGFVAWRMAVNARYSAPS